jgi:ring-1,2-phenylacetyl-CoA epoxidase subunit PaaE
MSEGFYPLKVSKAVKETSDATTFYFEVPSELESVFSYRAGQYLTFEVNIQGEKVRRSYSLCTYSGVDAQPGVTVKQVEGGKMSTYLNQNISVGDTLLVMPPMGKFVVDLSATNSKHYVLFGGGSGITPVMGIAKAVLNQEPNSKVTLVYANKNPDSVIFKDSLAKLESSNSGRFKVLHSYDTAPFTWFGLKGILTEEKIESIVKNKIGGSFDQYEYFICGPSPMMDVIKRGLTTIGVNKEKINIEYFSAPVNSEKTVEPVLADASFSGVSEITIHVYGKTHVIQCDENTTVLNAAMKQGIDPPYSCTVGVCTTCRARVHSGSVQMLEREGLSDSEIKDGFVLTCQSVPRTNKIELTYE